MPRFCGAFCFKSLYQSLQALVLHQLAQVLFNHNQSSQITAHCIQAGNPVKDNGCTGPACRNPLIRNMGCDRRFTSIAQNPGCQISLNGIQAIDQTTDGCTNIRTATRFEGFHVHGSDASSPGRGSTAMYLDGCGPEVTFANVSVVAGRGQDGVEGDDSSDNLAELDPALVSLDELEGHEGSSGGSGTGDGTCRNVPGGAAGVLRCGPTDVSGGRGADESCVRLACTNGQPCANAGCTDFTSGGVCDIATVLALASPNPAAQAGRGPNPGGAGATTYDAPTNRSACNFCDDNPTLQRDGDDGGDGAHGADGSGGSGCTGVPEFDTVTGRLRGRSGGDGMAGTHGSGGGGGTASGRRIDLGGAQRDHSAHLYAGLAARDSAAWWHQVCAGRKSRTACNMPCTSVHRSSRDHASYAAEADHGGHDDHVHSAR